jgi:iron(III) transport system permease protein
MTDVSRDRLLRPRQDAAAWSGASPAHLRWVRAVFNRRNAGLTAVILVLGFLSLYPLVMLLIGSVSSAQPGAAGHLTLEGYRQVASWRTLDLLGSTLLIATVKTALSLLLAIVLAWIVARTDTPGRGALEVLITLPFFFPPILTAMAWGMLGNPQVGLLNQAWRGLTGAEAPLLNIYSYGGVIWHMMQYSTPFLFIFVVDAFRAMDPALEEASRLSGASPWQTFRRVTLVLLLPVLTGGFILSFIRGIESFESPVLLGTPAGIEVLTTEIYRVINEQSDPNYLYATALSISMLAMMLILVLLQWRLLGGRSFQTVTGKGYTPRVTALGRWRWATFGFCLVFFAATVVLPVGQLLVGSFFQFFGFYELDMLTLKHWRAVFDNEVFWRALRNTVLLGVAGASATMLLGAIVAYIGVRTRWRVRRLVGFLAWLPWMMPGIVLGVGFLWGFAILPQSVPIYGTLWALLLAYIALGIPLSVQLMEGAFAQLATDLEECSRVHGAGWWKTLWRILVALTGPAVMAGWVLLFFGILRELSASILLYSVGSEVLSVVVLRLWSSGQAEQVSVIALLLLSLVLVFRLLQLRLIRRRLGVR